MRKRLSYANVSATIALFLALAGTTAFAASQLPGNSVGTKQLKRNAVTSIKVKDRSLSGEDINLQTLGTVPAAENAKQADNAAPSGPAGGDLTGRYPGPTIAAGSVTTAKLGPGIPHDIEVVVDTDSAGSNAMQTAGVACPPGKLAIGGGVIAPVMGALGFVALTGSKPTEARDGWEAEAIEVNGGSADNWGIRVEAICAKF